MTIQNILSEIQNNLCIILEKLEFPKVNFEVSQAKPGFGDFYSNISFLLSKELKSPPFEIAKIISKEFENFPSEFINKVIPHQSGFLNFCGNWKKLNKIILKSSIESNYGSINLGNNAKVIVEHTSVNPNKALHIGHIRNIVLGDSLSRILKKANFDVKVLNYVDDSGLQVADIILGFKHLGFSQTPNYSKKFDQYCGDEVYVKTTEKYENNPELEQLRKNILKELEDNLSEVSKFSKIITRKVLAEQLKTCWRMGVMYDCLNFESQIIHSGLWEKVFQKLKKSKLIYLETSGKNENCWMLKGFDNEEDKVLVRSNGVATYIAKDIPYAAWKLGLIDDPFYYKVYTIQKNNIPLFETSLTPIVGSQKDFSGEKVITVIDSRQSRLQKLIKHIMSEFNSKIDSYIHLAYESVTLSSSTADLLGIKTQGKETQMSGRRGIYVNADDVLEKLKIKSITETKKRNESLEDALVAQISDSISVGTLRYEMLKQDLDKIITFDLENSLRLDGDTASYIQYSGARSFSIIEKSKKIGISFSKDNPKFLELLISDSEIDLIKVIGSFEIRVKEAAENFSPKVICKYCNVLSVAFNTFYEKQKVLDNSNKSLSEARLFLVFSFKSVLEQSLFLLGIESPNQM